MLQCVVRGLQNSGTILFLMFLNLFLEYFFIIKRSFPPSPIGLPSGIVYIGKPK